MSDESDQLRPDEAPGEPELDEKVETPEPEEDIRERVEEAREPTRRLFGTFGGVFTPTLLTILGVIMFLRLGWVVGNAGVLGTMAILVLAFGITGATALAMSSIVTNIRIGAGGAYAIISQSLGLEIGGALGIPWQVSQALAITMYIFGLRAGWLWIFPDHPAIVVDLVAFALIWGIAYKSANLAVRIQFVIMVVIGLALASIVAAALDGSMRYPIEQVTVWGTYPGEPESGFEGTSFWHVFAVFFPAATGIMAGANMSGDLKEPKRAIPVGTMAAIGVSFVIYLLLAYWLARSASADELVGNYTVMIDKAFWGPAVLAGLIGATFSSALASTVGSARILQAMGEHRVVPAGEWIEKTTEEGEPRNALLVTGAIVLASIMLRELNVVAPLITMFFLLTYAMLCAVVLIEQSLNLVSFRPLLKIPRWVPLVGMIGTLTAMFVIAPVFGLVAVVVVVVVYAILARRELRAPFGDVRSGLFGALAEWAAKRVSGMPAATERAWKPNLLVPVEDPDELRGTFNLIRDLTLPQGSVKLVGLSPRGTEADLRERLPVLDDAFRNEGVFSTWTVLRAERYGEGLIAAVQGLRGAFFHPNVLFLGPPLEGDLSQEEALVEVIEEAQALNTGVLLVVPHPHAGLGRRRTIHVWVDDKSPDWDLSMDLGNLDLGLLLAWKLVGNWGGRIRVITAVEDPGQADAARDYLRDLVELARMPGTEAVVRTGAFEEALVEAPQADVTVFGLPDPPDFEFVRRTVEKSASTCMFVRDSGEENALA